jgi:hypothetical protein
LRQQKENAAMDAVPKFETFTRIGFAARGLIYILIGYMAVETGRNTDTSGALRSLEGGGLNQILLAVIALGLIAYGVWRLSDAAFDLEGHGQEPKGALVRGGHAISGVTHILLGLLALGLSLGMAGGSGGGGAQSTTAWLLGLPAGEILVRLIGAGFIAAGIAQGVAAVRLKFLRQLDPAAARQTWVKWAGRIGYAARGLIFLMVGLFFWRAGAASDAGEAGGLGEALASLPGSVRGLVAAGLILFGAFSIVQAIYRRISDPRLAERLRPSG